MRALLVLVAACGGASATVPEPPTRWSDAYLLGETDAYLHDPAARRAALEAALTNPRNMYSRLRLVSYGLPDGGWDLLPVWNPRSVPVTAERAAILAREDMPALPADQPPLWDGKTPQTMAEWVALGRRVFLEYPMRAEVFMEYALARPELAASIGLSRTRDGAVPGLVVFANIDGETRVGITCAICHATVRDGELVLGAAHRTFDYGRLRVTYDRDNGVRTDPEQARRMARWGPGRADVTEDDDEDPVAIPDLWGLRDQPYLTQAGTIRHASPLALAIRQETQLTDSNHQRVRPPRELAWALAMFVYSLAPPPRPVTGDVARGRALFERDCRGCHANRAYGGELVRAEDIGTDPALANGRGRGTGMYRVPQLLGVGGGAPYLHHGVVASLDDLLSPTRGIPGHRAGTELGDADRAALVAFLETL